MRRGFVKEAEKHSEDYRRQLGLTVLEACPARRLARRLGVILVATDKVVSSMSAELYRAFSDYLGQPPEEAIAILSQGENGFFGKHILIGSHRMVFFNPSCAPTRQESDIMHELAHVICGHQGQAVSLDSMFALREVDPHQEAEANRLGSILQVPGEGLFRHTLDGRTNEEIADIYGCSPRMVSWRAAQTAVKRRVAAYRRKRGF